MPYPIRLTTRRWLQQGSDLDRATTRHAIRLGLSRILTAKMGPLDREQAILDFFCHLWQWDELETGGLK